jgi:ABC-type dipeptide/oligopeptide/nickel transport system ATPase component
VVDIVKADKQTLKDCRREMRMIFQDPVSSLNPRMTVAQIVGEPLLVNGIATGKAVNCSSEQAAHPARQANDGDPNTRWCAGDDHAGNWWQVDLNKAYDLERIKILWEFDDRPELYKIEGSANARQWTPLVDRTDHLDIAKQTEHPVSARGIRYVRITITGSKDSRPAGFSEFQVFGHPSSEDAGRAVAPPKSVTPAASTEAQPAK